MTQDDLIEKVKNLLKELSKLEYGTSTPMSKEECWKLAEEIIFKAILKHGEEVRLDTLTEAEQELEKAFEECKTYNLLHGAARIRTLRNQKGGKG